MASPNSITGSVADLFATLGLDTGPLSVSLAESVAMIKEAGADMSLSLGALQARYQQVINSLTSGTEATTAYQAALQSLGVATGTNSKLTQAQVAALGAEKDALEQLIRAEQMALDVKIRSNQEVQGEIQAAAIEQQLAEKRVAQLNQIAFGEAKAAEINQMAADARIEAANQVAIGEARAAAIELEAANQRVAMANLIAEGTARAEAIETAAVDEAVRARILRYNQEAEGAARAAAIEKEARMSLIGQGTGGVTGFGSARLGANGVNPSAGIGGPVALVAAAGAFVGYEAVKQAAEFTDALNKALSIMHDVSDFQKGEMRESALALSQQYGISAVEIAHAFYTMESAGRTVNQALGEMPAVAAYAFTASSDGVIKMDKAAEQLTSVFNALKGSGVSIERVSDLLLKADSIAQGTGEQFAKALAGKGAGAIQILGKSAEEGLAILATMAKVGIPAAQQQSALIQILRDLPKEAEKYSDVIITLNGHQMTYKELLYDSTGQMKDFAVILGELEQLFAGASTEVIQHDLALLHLNSRTNQSIQSMIGMSSTVADYEKQLKGAAGTTQEIAAIRLESPITQFSRLGTAIKTLGIDVGTLALSPLGKIAGLFVEGATTAHQLYISLTELAGTPIMQLYLKGLSIVSGKTAFDFIVENMTAGLKKIKDLLPESSESIGLRALKDLSTKGNFYAPKGVVGDSGVYDPNEDAKRKAAADRAARMRNEIATVLLDTQRKQEEAAIDLEIEDIRKREQLHLVSSQDELARLHELEDQKLDIEAKYAIKRLALEDTSNKALYDAKVRGILADKQIAHDKEDQAYDIAAEAEKLKIDQKIAEYTAKTAEMNEKATQAINTRGVEAWSRYHAEMVKAQDKQTQITTDIHDRLPAAFIPTYDAAYKLEQSFKKLGMTSVNSAGEAQSAWVGPFEDIAAHAKTLVEVEGAWGAISRRLVQVGKTDLPLVVQIQNEYIAALIRTHAPLVQILEAEQDNLKTTIDLKTRRGESNDAEMIALEDLRIRTNALKDSTHELGLMYLSTTKNVGKLWTDFGNGAADAILVGGKFWSFWHKIMQDFEKEMLRTVVNGALKSFKDAVLSIPGVSSSFGGAFSKLLGVGGSTSLGEKMGPPEATAAQVAALAANTTATTADTTVTVADTTATTTDTVATTANAVVTGVNAAATTADAIVTGVNTAAVIANTGTMAATTATEVSSRLITNATEMANNVATTANTAAVVANTAAVATAAATDAAGSAVGAAGSLGGGVAGIVGKAASASIGAIVNVVSGVVSAISGVIGNFQMAGMNKTLDLIENYTRYLKIGLVEQGDSLLNDSHVIRNTLTDFMAWNWGVATTYFQGFSEKLDVLIAHGGVPGITGPQQMALPGGGSTNLNIPTGENAVSDQSINIDLSGSTFTGGVSSQQVDQIFNKGIDRAKRAGAFRPGTWPR